MSHADQRPTPPPQLFARGPAAWPLYDPEIAELLAEMARDGSWGRYDGPYGERLVSQLTRLVDLPFVFPCSSGTIAVELALRGLGVQPADEIVVGAYDFPGNFRAIEALGAKPVLVDIEPDTWGLDPQQVADAVGPATRAILCSHLHGGLTPMPQLREIADGHGVALVEDVCQAPGARIAGRTAGQWGDVAVFSFGGSKLLTAGRGGAVVTARQEVFQRVKIFAERGNLAFPLSEMQAAVLLPQFDKLAERNRIRETNAALLLDLLSDLEGLGPVRDWRLSSGDAPSFYKLGWRVEWDEASLRDNWVAAAHQAGIALDPGFRGFAGRSAKRCRKVGNLPHAKRAAERTLVLHHPVLLAASSIIRELACALRAIVQDHAKYA
jgi:perosamine synthetase